MSHPRHPGTPPVGTRHGRLKRSSTWKSIAKIAGAMLGVVLVSGSAVGAYAAWDLANTIKPGVKLGNEEALANVPDIGAIDGGVNVLIIGSDSRAGQGDAFGDPDEETAVLNDVTMLFHIAQDHSHASVISFPRDMLVDVPECVDPEDPGGEPLWELYDVKINSVLDWGGMACVARTVEEMTGTEIQFAGTVQFLGVAALSEAIGGVEVCVAEPIEDEHTDLYLPAGMNELKGMPALQFLRTRHGVGDGSDLGRISNQQVFLSALARKVQSDGTLSDPGKLYGIAKAALQNMELSEGLINDPMRMVSIALALKDVDLSQIQFIQYPTVSNGAGAQEATESAEVVNLALQQDVPVVFDAEAQQDVSFGSTVTPTPPAEGEAAPPADEPVEEAPPADDAAAAEGEGEGTAPAPTPTVEALPSDVYGQTAAEERCSAGRTLDDQ